MNLSGKILTSLDKKLLRDTWKMKGQSLAIALVIASGVATYIMSLSTLNSLQETQAAYYDNYRLGDVFASLKRAPESLKSRISKIPGVENVSTRVASEIRLEVTGFSEPITGRLTSISDSPGSAGPLLNRLYLKEGRLVKEGTSGEVVISRSFSEAHDLKPGDKLKATINGRQKSLAIVGVALSPEYIYQIKPGSLIPDFERYAIIWMGITPMRAAFDMEGAFNDVVLSTAPKANIAEIIDRLDDILDPYGGLGSYGRKDQLSNRYLSEEFKMLSQMATIFPVIFLGVAAFLLNVVMTRLVSTQREQIGLLKAFGYRNIDIALHFIKFVFLVMAVGLTGGIIAGIWLGRNLSEMYMVFYRFPFITYELRPSVIASAALITSIAVLTGTLFAIRRASAMPPAEAMLPEPPVSYRETIVERLGLKNLFSQPGRMIIRHIERRPVKSALSVIGIGFACAIMMMGTYFDDSVDMMVENFALSNREDITVTFTEPASTKALYELMALPGVEYAEPFRTVPARFVYGHRSYRAAVEGIPAEGELSLLLNEEMKQISIPGDGIVLTDHLGGILGVSPGDILTVETLEGDRRVREVMVSALISEFIGVSAYMEIGALNRFMGEGNVISGVNLDIDSEYRGSINRRLNETPRVAGTDDKLVRIQNVYDTMGEQTAIFTFFITILAGTIAFGVVYNSARIALSERSRELASLRVLGFTRGEISFILLGEQAALTLAAIPVGFLLGRWLCAGLNASLQTDLFRIPLVLNADTYAFAAVIVLVSACISGLIVRRKLDHLDLVEVLKARE